MYSDDLEGNTVYVNGVSNLELDPISVPNGTRIDFQVCVNYASELFCVLEDFMVWGETP